jgi:hypothetical protein
MPKVAVCAWQCRSKQENHSAIEIDKGIAAFGGHSLAIVCKIPK